MASNWKKSGLLFILTVAAAAGVKAQVYTGTKMEKHGGSNSYHLSIGNYFNVSEKQILECSKAVLLEEELPVVFYTAQRAGVSPQEIVRLHAGGMSWMQVARHFDLSPRFFYVPVSGKAVYGPYKKIYAYYQGKRARILLTDADIVNLVNLKFMSDHYGHDPREIMQLRGKGKTFPDIDDTFKQEKEDMHWDAEDAVVEVRDSKGRPDPRKGDRNSMDPAERQKNR